MLKRFWLFGGNRHYPSGGMQDFLDSYDTLQDAMTPNCDRVSSFEWAHIFDSHTAIVVAAMEMDERPWSSGGTDWKSMFGNLAEEYPQG